jgi:hypothetical protein
LPPILHDGKLGSEPVCAADPAVSIVEGRPKPTA